ncbi:MAG: hypothetical protein B7733_03035 [Myxococcales bacterium FL481]|nr:MAG: hypothetical protein B7733_03035 [Myxococcales bacterium FL481]
MTPAARHLPLLSLLLSLACPRPDARPDGQASADAAVRVDVERFAVPQFPNDRALGGQAPLVTLVVFGNYACPPCGRTWLMARNLVEDYGENIRVVYRHAPIPGYQPGDLAAEAVVAAGEQESFWAYHWRLIEHSDGDFSRPALLAHAQALGLDVDKFAADLDGGLGSAALARYRRQALALGIAAGPVTFINGLVLMGGQANEAAWHTLIDAEIARARALLRDGVARADVYAEITKGAKVGRIRETDAATKLREEAKRDRASHPSSDGGGSSAFAVDKRPEADKRYRVVADGVPVDGPADAPVLVVAFVDFQCPFCRKSAGLLGELRAKFPQDVKVAVRHLPLPIHPTAPGSAYAAEAAHRQGKFWPFHDRLLTAEGPAGLRQFTSLADELGLDVAQFKRDFEDPTIRTAVERDLSYAKRLGVAGTPAYFVNGRFLYGSQSLATVAGLVEEELKAAADLGAAGTSRAELFGKLMASAIPESQFPNAPEPVSHDEAPRGQE